jgi:hypothetical protein
MRAMQDNKPFIIYALVCPLTLEVKYVGQTIDLEQRTRGKTHKSSKHAPLTEWLRTLGYLRPYKVILERGINRRVELPKRTRTERRGRKCILESTWLSTCLEAKWIKRFRRTIINRNKMIDASALLVNPPLPWESGPRP